MWPKMEHSVGRKGAVNSKVYGQSPPSASRPLAPADHYCIF